MKEKRPQLLDNLVYLGATMGANLIGSIVMILFISIFSRSGGREMVIKNYRSFSVLFCAVSIAVSSYVTYRYLKRKIPDMLRSDGDISTDKKTLLRLFGMLILPGELARSVLVSLPILPGSMFGYRFFDGIFAMAPNFLYDQLYLVPRGGIAAIRSTGYSFGDNLVFVLFYLLYFVVFAGILFYFFSKLWNENAELIKKKEKMRMGEDTADSTIPEKQRVIDRDFYYKREITRPDVLKYAGITILANLMTYYVVVCIDYFLSILEGTASYVLFQFIISIPICAILPSLSVYYCLRHAVPKYFSLADTPDTWRKKALRWVGIGELLRMSLGLIPLSITKFGAMTSPLTYHLYTLVYVEPMGRFDTIMLNGGAGLGDIAVFLLIYLLYFALYAFLLDRRIKKEIIRHQKYLEGCIKEKERFYDFNKNNKNNMNKYE